MNAIRLASQYGSYTSVLQPFLAGADHVDTKRVRGAVSLERFIAGMLNYYPWWLRLLYLLRAGVVKMLGLKDQKEEAESTDFFPKKISFKPGEKVSFFTVRSAENEKFWIAETPEDKHLRAYLAILSLPSTNDSNEFQITTIVHYKHWSGPVYFNLIRPFHHLVVSRMARAGVSAD